MTPATDSLRPGALLAGKYRLGRLLGEGGMGMVFVATHEALGHTVALKVMRADAAKAADGTARFLQEARAAAQLQSEHVAKVYDFGTLEDGSPYLVMEYLHGRDVQYALDKTGKLPPPLAIDIVLQACDALREAHHAGIVHRDLKPQNLFLVMRYDQEVFVKVLDFGIAKLLGTSGRLRADVLTQTNAVLGTPLYMAPEQLRASKQVDSRADVWSLGVILYQLLSGRLPFEAESLAELSVKVFTEPPQPLDVPDLPEELWPIVEKCLQRDVELRFTDAAELAMALKPLRHEQVPSLPDLSRPQLDELEPPPASEIVTERRPRPAPQWPADTLLAASEPASTWRPHTGDAVILDAPAHAPHELPLVRVHYNQRPWWPWAVAAAALLVGGGMVWHARNTPAAPAKEIAASASEAPPPATPSAQTTTEPSPPVHAPHATATAEEPTPQQPEPASPVPEPAPPSRRPGRPQTPSAPAAETTRAPKTAPTPRGVNGAPIIEDD